MFAQRIYEQNEICKEINDYLNYFDYLRWGEYTGINNWKKAVDDDGIEGYIPDEYCEKREVRIALNICTFHRREQILKNLEKLRNLKFFDPDEGDYYGRLHVFITDNGAELEGIEDDFFHLRHNRNTGGSGGFQKGLERIRAAGQEFTHVIFMDDDADFLPETFYRLYALLSYMKPEHFNRTVAGRMFCLDNPSVQYSAAEIWNKGDLQHVGAMKDMSLSDFADGLNDTSEAEYNGWWFCCFPYEFCSNNDVMPFFLHCDDVEYGLRFNKMGGGSPIILNGIQVWHETVVYRQKPIIQYYDMRNPLFVNRKLGLMDNNELLNMWKQRIGGFHACGDYDSEYYAIIALFDFMKGEKWLYGIDPEKHHKRLGKKKGGRLKNALMWRIGELMFKITTDKV